MNREQIDTKRLGGEKDRPDRPIVYPIVIYAIFPVSGMDERSDDERIGVEFVINLQRW